MTAHVARGIRRVGMAACLSVLGAVACWSVLVGGTSGCRDRAAPTKREVGTADLEQRLNRASRALLELDVVRARSILDSVSERSPEIERLRARLALSVGDCQGALALLSQQGKLTPTEPPASNELLTVANGCARAMAGAVIASDESRGVWVRFQNDHDRVLLPLIADTADRAARVVGQHLGTALPRPLRIEVVSDLASLCAVTGLPLEAAETTGTIAIARWGKVTLVSPRATPEGYPWQDTLAHELTHLLIARQSAEAAPLWLQEGIAKREETRWRDPLPLDDTENARAVARRALLEGHSVGIDRLGPSIAMLPNPRAAEIAYAEVRDFVDYWIESNGPTALRLLLRDLAGLGDSSVDRALSSVSGYTLQQWILRWQHALIEPPRHAELGSARGEASTEPTWDIEAARRLRLAELFEGRRHFEAVARELAPYERMAPLLPELGHRLAFGYLHLGQVDRARSLLTPERVSHLDGTWLAIRGRALGAAGDEGGAESAFQHSLAFAPTLEKVACRGFALVDFESVAVPVDLPKKEPWRSLCQALIDASRE